MRAVIILHPDFDKPGKAGILEAKEFAEGIVKSNRELIEVASKSQTPEVVDGLRAHIGQIQVLVRNLPEDII